MFKIAATRILELKTGWAMLHKGNPVAGIVETAGEYLEDAVEQLAEMVPPGSIVVELGGPFGIASTRFARLVGDSGKVYALAADPAGFRNLCANLAMNRIRNVKPLEIFQAPDHRNAEFSANRALLGRIGRVPVDFDLALLGETACQLIFSTLSTRQFLPIVRSSTAFIAQAKPVVAFKNDGDDASAALQKILTQAGYQLFSQETTLVREDNHFGEDIGQLPTITMTVALNRALLDALPT